MSGAIFKEDRDSVSFLIRCVRFGNHLSHIIAREKLAKYTSKQNKIINS